MSSPYVFSRKQYTLPVEDIRVKPSAKLSWDELLTTRRQILQCYEIMRTKILSRLKPTNLRDLRDLLVYNYYFSNAVVDDLFYFISANETKHVEFEEENGCLISDQIYLKPRVKLSCPCGPYSVFIPNVR